LLLFNGAVQRAGPEFGNRSAHASLRHAELYKAHLGVAEKYLSDCEMGIRERELAILRVGWLSQAPSRRCISAGERRSGI
jgi:hypothetical protein